MRIKSFIHNFGFTLIEALVAIGIFGFAVVTVSVFILIFYRTYNYSFQQAAAIEEARKGIETMAREIRKAQTGEDGSYLIEKADDNEFIFYSDIDQDGAVERVRYFLGGTSQGTLSRECVSYINGGICNVDFTDFFTGALETAQVTASVEGDFGAGNEYADLFTDSDSTGSVCRAGCDDCAGVWQGALTFDVKNQAMDNGLVFLADASDRVNSVCDWINPNHSMKARFDLNWTETFASGQTEFKKGIIDPTGFPPTYPEENEEINVLSRYVRNVGQIFKYFDKEGVEITTYPARLEETTLMRLDLIINIDINRAPDNFELESDVQLRNLKTNL